MGYDDYGDYEWCLTTTGTEPLPFRAKLLVFLIITVGVIALIGEAIK